MTGTDDRSARGHASEKDFMDASIAVSRRSRGGQQNEARIAYIGRHRLPGRIVHDVPCRGRRHAPPYGPGRIRGPEDCREDGPSGRAARGLHRKRVPRVLRRSRHQREDHPRECGPELHVRPVQEDHAPRGQEVRAADRGLRHRDGGLAGPGRIADAHEHKGGAGGPGIPDHPSAHRPRQGRDHRDREEDWHLRHLHREIRRMQSRSDQARYRGEAGEGGRVHRKVRLRRHDRGLRGIRETDPPRRRRWTSLSRKRPC